MNNNSALSYSLLLLFLCGCQPIPYAAAVGGKRTENSANFEVDLPDGWKRHNLLWDRDPSVRGMLSELKERRQLATDAVRITKDGLVLQQIAIGRMPIEKDLPYTNRRFSRGMLPNEQADVIIDNLCSNFHLTDQQIIENAPATVGGHPGFKLTYTYKTKNELTMRGAYYGLLLDTWHYYLVYEAPAQHYFPKGQADFEKIKASFRILKAGGT